MEAQAGLQLVDQLRHVFVAQRRIAEVIGNSAVDNGLAGELQHYLHT